MLYLQYLEKQVDPALLQEDDGQGQRRREGVQRLPRQGRRQGDDRQRGPQGPQEVEGLAPSGRPSGRRARGSAPVVEADLKELVKLRNEAATQLGFTNYHALQLHLNEQKQARGAQAVRRARRADPRAVPRRPRPRSTRSWPQNYGIAVDELRPWHYHDPFFQESPAVFAADLDAAFAKADILKLCREFYAGIGLPIDDVLARSDLYEKPGKSPHAFCTDIDREGDVRVLANIVPNEYWMGTMLHELGHSVYSSKNIPPSVPYVAAHRGAHPDAPRAWP